MVVTRGSMSGQLALEAAAGSGAPLPKRLARSNTYARKLRPLPAGRDTDHGLHKDERLVYFHLTWTCWAEWAIPRSL